MDPKSPPEGLVGDEEISFKSPPFHDPSCLDEVNLAASASRISPIRVSSQFSNVPPNQTPSATHPLAVRVPSLGHPPVESSSQVSRPSALPTGSALPSLTSHGRYLRLSPWPSGERASLSSHSPSVFLTDLPSSTKGLGCALSRTISLLPKAGGFFRDVLSSCLHPPHSRLAVSWGKGGGGYGPVGGREKLCARLQRTRLAIWGCLQVREITRGTRTAGGCVHVCAPARPCKQTNYHLERTAIIPWFRRRHHRATWSLSRTRPKSPKKKKNPHWKKLLPHRLTSLVWSGASQPFDHPISSTRAPPAWSNSRRIAEPEPQPWHRRHFHLGHIPSESYSFCSCIWHWHLPVGPARFDRIDIEAKAD
ncbi:hypothetical protein BDP55DRAFT_179297 [Colletotrichum godetiae]|uniref:Uncharacterized protein n=1 Tax=Colletotrichum godetiae TaxID=1209918 RepID=A0AAJ0ALI6_9PEZI|nr:uncharacterized protein BDP55DRAFT_179297 [Colletotrichum godetiae]KAK1674623.1 hypothetical protein BDP55DRAFT_179297 [Colletotrichum godetiae]